MASELSNLQEKKTTVRPWVGRAKSNDVSIPSPTVLSDLLVHRAGSADDDEPAFGSALAAGKAS